MPAGTSDAIVPGDTSTPPGRSAEKFSPLERALHLVALSGLAIAQPIFDIVSRYPTFLVAHDAGRAEVLSLVGILSILLPLCLLLIEQSVGFVHRRIRYFLHLSIVLLLALAIALQASRSLTDSPWLTSMLATGIALGFTVIYARFQIIRSFTSALSIAGIVFPALFILDPAVRRLVFPSVSASGSFSLTRSATGKATPVVLVVFDELPLVSLLDSAGNIDSIRYPNLSRLAETSLWFKNATTVSDATALAVPALLDGQYPRDARMPIFEDHPDSLFTLLAPSHELHLFEHFTRMAPPDARTTRDQRLVLRELYRDIGVIYLHVITPVSLAHRLPPITDSWKNFAGEVKKAAPRPDWGDFQGNWAARNIQFAEFLASITRGDRPGFFFFHSMLPHASWSYLPSGKEYSLHQGGLVTGVVGPNRQGIHPQQWIEDEWVVAQSYQRHLLQVGYVDTLVGQLIARTKETGIYDDALIIVTADHGASFNPGDNRRQVTMTNAGEIMLIPLLVKLPGQTQGDALDLNVELIDVFPTVLELLNIVSASPIDGRSLLNAEKPERKFLKIVSEKGRETIFQPPLPGADSMLRWKIQLFGERSSENLFKIGPYPELRSRRLSELPIGAPMDMSVALQGEHLYRSVRLAAHFVPQDIRGHIEGDSDKEIFPMAIAINGSIAGLTRTYRAGEKIEFSSVVSADSLREGANKLELFLIETQSGRPRLRPLGTSKERTPGRSYSLVGPAGMQKIAVDGKPLAAGEPGWAGWVISRVMAGEMIQIAGWAGNVANGKVGEIVMFRDGALLGTTACDLPKPDIVKTYNQPGLANSGFSMIFPLETFSSPERTELRVFVVSLEGKATELHYPQDAANWNFSLRASLPK